MTVTNQTNGALRRGDNQQTLPRLLLCAALTAIGVGALIYVLWHYKAHEIVGLWPEMLSFAAIVCTAFSAVRFAKGKAWVALSFALVCLAVSAAVFLIARRIPDCVECQHLTKADLGLLSRWIWAPD